MAEGREPIVIRPDPEKNRQQEMRSSFLVPVYVIWTSNVPPQEAQVALQGVRDAVRASGQDREVVSFGSKPWSAGDFGSADWYLQEANRRHPKEIRNGPYGPQLWTWNFMRLFHKEPWQVTPHWEVAIVNQDLYAAGTNFVFGETDVSFPASLNSLRRFVEEIPDVPLRLAVVRRLLRHEVGHMLGLPGRNYRVEEKLGPHCTNVCTMRQGMSLPEWAKLTREEERQGTHFCRDCMNDFAMLRLKYKPLPPR